jgi:hypothetical protein
MCQRGAILSEVAEAFNVSTRTLFNWLNLHPELHDAVQVGVDTFNSRVERALAERAIGFWIVLEEAQYDADDNEIRPARRQYFPPDVTAGIFFLKNRLRERWRDVYEKVEKHELKTSAELLVEINKELGELHAKGYLKEIPQLSAPKKTNGR